MGILRIILALSVVVAHVGPFLGMRFFGGGTMSVETFYMLSGFYMALVLSRRYRGRIRDFYFNRFLRLFPLYWSLLATLLVVSCLYWVAVGHPLGALADWRKPHSAFEAVWACISNFAMVGTDWASLYCTATGHEGQGVIALIAIKPIWTLGIEITFYLAAPFILRMSAAGQGAVFLATLLLRTAVWVATGSHWTIWITSFAPSSWVLFMGGVEAYHLMVWLEKRSWFARAAVPAGYALVAVISAWIAFYAQAGILGSQDWRYYTLVGLSLPFLFAAFKDSAFDAVLAGYSYPIYLAHSVILSLYAPLRHFVPDSFRIYVILLLTIALSAAVLRLDRDVQHRFKRVT